jgi:Protein of unknown function (DUF2442)
MRQTGSHLHAPCQCKISINLRDETIAMPSNARNRKYVDAMRSGEELLASYPTAIAAFYNKKANRIVISLSSRIEIMFNPADVQDLEDAKPSQLLEIEISPSGFDVHFPALDADVAVRNLLEGVLGSRKWMAARLGTVGGSSRNKPKAVRVTQP